MWGHDPRNRGLRNLGSSFGSVARFVGKNNLRIFAEILFDNLRTNVMML